MNSYLKYIAQALVQPKWSVIVHIRILQICNKDQTTYDSIWTCTQNYVMSKTETRKESTISHLGQVQKLTKDTKKVFYPEPVKKNWKKDFWFFFSEHMYTNKNTH